jgi:hypothetical protein
LRWRGTSAPAWLLWAELILHRYVVGTALHIHHIGPILERLGEIAYVTDDVMVTFKGERDDRDKAECEPRVALDDMSGVVTAVVTLASDALVSFNLLAEGMFAAGKY